MTIKPKKNKARENAEQESSNHTHSHHSHGNSRESSSSHHPHSISIVSGLGHSNHLRPPTVIHGIQNADCIATASVPNSWNERNPESRAGESSAFEEREVASTQKRRHKSPCHTHKTSRKQYRSHGSSRTESHRDGSEPSPPSRNSDDENEMSLPREQEMEIIFSQSLKKDLGLEIKVMESDGACLFRAVADQVYGDQGMHDVIRRHCIQYMKKNRDHFSQYITENFEDYLTRKAEITSHGNHVEIQALSEMYSRTIEVYQYSTTPMNVFSMADSEHPIRISYHGNVHYNSLVDPFKGSIGVGLGIPDYQPGQAERNLMQDALAKSEDGHIEEAMLTDKLKETDWEYTDEALQEQVARESYLQWVRDNEQRKAKDHPASTAACSSSTQPEQTSSASKPAQSVDWLTNHQLSPTAQGVRSSGPGSKPRSSGIRSPKSLPSPGSSNTSGEPPSLTSSAPSERADSSSSSSLVGPLSEACLGPKGNEGVSAAGAIGGGACGGSGIDVAGIDAAVEFAKTASLMGNMPQVSGFDEDEALLAQVIAESKREYMESLKKQMSPRSDKDT